MPTNIYVNIYTRKGHNPPWLVCNAFKPQTLYVHRLIFFSQLFLSGVTKADQLFPSLPVLCILLCPANHLHVFVNNSHKSLLLPLFPLCLAALSSTSFSQYNYSISSLCRCPDHFNLTSLTLSPNCQTWAVPLIHSFLILYILAYPMGA